MTIYSAAARNPVHVYIATRVCHHTVNNFLTTSFEAYGFESLGVQPLSYSLALTQNFLPGTSRMCLVRTLYLLFRSTTQQCLNISSIEFHRTPILSLLEVLWHKLYFSHHCIHIHLRLSICHTPSQANYVKFIGK